MDYQKLRVGVICVLVLAVLSCVGAAAYSVASRVEDRDRLRLEVEHQALYRDLVENHGWHWHRVRDMNFPFPPEPSP